MMIDFWSIGLQAVNVIILVWLLSRVFWRPVAEAIAKRRDAARSMLDTAEATQTKADAALAELTAARAGIAGERETVLAEAAAAAETSATATLVAAREKATSLIAAAQQDIDRDHDATYKKQATRAAELAVDIATKLLVRGNKSAVQDTFLASLIEAITQMSSNDRATLARSETGIELVSATEPDETKKSEITKTVEQALGGTPELTFVTDPALIAGLEIRTTHFALRNSWQMDLARILKDLKNAT